MKAAEAKAIAKEWAKAYAKEQPILAAMLNGSVLSMSDDDDIPDTSDVDINMIVHEEPGEKPGKFRHHGALLEASFIRLEQIRPFEKALTTYEIAGCFRGGGVLYDPDGVLAETIAYVAPRFAQPAWVKARCQKVYDKIENGVSQYDAGLPLLGNVNRWLFPAGILTHAVLVGALRNPTVRLRYLRAREVLEEWHELLFYEALLDVLGCRKVTRAQASHHLDRLEAVYDEAARLRRSSFFFQNDIAPSSRNVAIDGSRALIEAGDHREAIFWMAATFERCHKILRQDAPDVHARYWPDMLALLEDLGAETNEKVATRIGEIRAMVPRVREVVERHIAEG